MKASMIRAITLACGIIMLAGCTSTPAANTTGPSDGTVAEPQPQTEPQPQPETPPVLEGNFLFGDGIERGVMFGRYQWTAITLQDDGSYDADEDEAITGTYTISDEPNENGLYTLTLLDADGTSDTELCSTTQQEACDDPNSAQPPSTPREDCTDNCEVPQFNKLAINQYEIDVTKGDTSMPDEFTLTPVLSERDRHQLEYEPWTSTSGHEHKVYNYDWGCGWEYGYHYYQGYDEPDPIEDCMIDTDTWTWTSPSVGTFRRM